MRRSTLQVLVLSLLSTRCASSPATKATQDAELSTGTNENPTPKPNPAAVRQAMLEAQVDRTLAELDQDAEPAQPFGVGVHLDELPTGDPRGRDSRAGGIFLRGRSAAPAAVLAETTARWNSLTTGPAPWVASDQEGGRARTVSGPGFGQMPPAWDQGQLPIGMAAQGVTTTSEPFPGLGFVRDNTDTTPDVRDTVIGPDHQHVTAFGQLAQAPAAPFVMMSSTTYELIDPAHQAAFSHTTVTGLLRGRLGFTGVVISGDIGAAVAVHGMPPCELAVRSLDADGTPVLKVAGAVFPEMLAAVRERVAADPPVAQVVDAAVRTALLAKARAGSLHT